MVPERGSEPERLRKPGVVDVLPVELVEPLIARHEKELRGLRLELEQAQRDAAAAERRLHAHAAAAVYDDAFEAAVLAHVARSVSSIEHRSDDVAAPGVKGTSGSAAFVSPPEMSPTIGENPPARRGASAEPPGRGQRSSSSPDPRAVVVDRNRPRTVVVDRDRPVEAAPISDPPPVRTGVSGGLGAEPRMVLPSRGSLPGPDQTGAPGDGRARRRHSGRTTGMSARLLIQAGVIVVIVALLLLKLG